VSQQGCGLRWLALAELVALIGPPESAVQIAVPKTRCNRVASGLNRSLKGACTDLRVARQSGNVEERQADDGVVVSVDILERRVCAIKVSSGCVAGVRRTPQPLHPRERLFDVATEPLVAGLYQGRVRPNLERHVPMIGDPRVDLIAAIGQVRRALTVRCARRERELCPGVRLGT
jgi:hypothetical protein